MSLETRKHTPQIVYASTNRQVSKASRRSDVTIAYDRLQPINKVDVLDLGSSSFGGSNTILQLSHGSGGNAAHEAATVTGYPSRHATINGSANPLRSFVHMNAPPPPPPPPPASTSGGGGGNISHSPILHHIVEPAAARLASVRPVLIASPNNVRASAVRPANVVFGKLTLIVDLRDQPLTLRPTRQRPLGGAARWPRSSAASHQRRRLHLLAIHVDARLKGGRCWLRWW